MIVNGKDINVNFRKAEEIQKRMNPVDALPETLKVEASQKEIKELESFDADALMNADFSFQNNNTFLSKEGRINRKEYYQTFQDMSNCNFIHRGLQIIADDCSQKNQEGHTVKINSDDDEIKEILEVKAGIRFLGKSASYIAVLMNEHGPSTQPAFHDDDGETLMGRRLAQAK